MLELNFSNLLRNMWTVVSRRGVLLVPLFVVAMVLPAMRAYMALEGTLTVATSVPLQIGGGIIGLLTQAVATLIALDALDNRQSSLSEMLSFSTGRLLPTIGTGILYYLTVVIGTLCLIIPGVVFYFMFFPAMSVTLAEGLGPIDSMKRAKELMFGNKLELFIALFLLSLFACAIYFVSALVAGMAFIAVGTLAWVLVVPAMIFILAAFSTLPGVVYHALANRSRDRYDG